MSDGQHFAGAAMRASRGMNAERDALVVEIVEGLEPIMRRIVQEEVPRAVAAVMTPEAAEQFWTVGFNVAQKHIANKAGWWFLGSIGKALQYLFWGAVFVYLLFSAFGWSGIKAVLFSAKGS